MHISKGLKQAYAMQDFAFDSAMSLREALSKGGRLNITREDSQAIAQLVKAWEIAQDRIRIHRNKPLPGVMKPEPKRKTAQPSSITVLEPISADDAPATGESVSQ